MPKWILYLIIAGLLAVVLYLVLPDMGKFEGREPTETMIEISEPVITRSTEEVPTSTEKTETPERELLAISGRLVRFEEVPERATGQLHVYAMIDDGTEFITIDMSRVVNVGVSSPEDQLGLTLGQNVTIHGELVDGMFIASDIE